MEEVDCEFREKKVVEEGSEVTGDEAAVDGSVYDHQLFDEMPVGVREFCSVKILPLENLNIDAMIKKAEETIEKMNQDQIRIAQKMRERKMDRDGLNFTLRNMKYYDENAIALNCHRERLNTLRLSLDKLTFAYNSYKGKPINSCLLGGEVDKQKLCFLVVNGCKNMADERKLLREVNASQGKDDGMTIDELHAPIQNLQQRLRFNYWGNKRTNAHIARDQAIIKEIEQHEIARERAIAGAVVNGKLWNSLGSRTAIQAEATSARNLMEEKYMVKIKTRNVKRELVKVEKDIISLQECLKDTNHKKNEAYNTIIKVKKQHEEEGGQKLYAAVEQLPGFRNRLQKEDRPVS